ncbi:MAG: hypothetical protein ACI81P_000426, partial [Neolewinella sp.]
AKNRRGESLSDGTPYPKHRITPTLPYLRAQIRDPMPNISQEDLQLLVDTPFDSMNAYYDRVAKKVVRAWNLDVYDKGSLKEESEAEIRADAERYATDKARYEPIYELSSSDSFRSMAAFIEQLPEGADHTALEQALNSQDPFQSFKDVVEDTSVRAEWLAYRDAQQAEQFRREILLSLGEEDVEDVELPAEENAPIDPETTDFDIDAENADLPFQFDWLAEEHGIKVREEDVRNTPPEVAAFRATVTEEDLDNPRNYLRKVEPMQKKYPNEPMLAIELAGAYAMTGKTPKARRLMERITRDFPDHLELNITNAMSSEDEEEFLKELKQFPRPLDIRKSPAGTDDYYHTLEFLAFEEMAIRAALLEDKLEEARQRLDRLVCFGFLHGDVETSAMAIAAAQLEVIMDGVNEGEAPLSETALEPFAEVSDRTKSILEISMKEVAVMMREYEEEQQKAATPVRHLEPKVGRNDPCPCGSGRKHKQCCLRK